MNKKEQLNNALKFDAVDIAETLSPPGTRTDDETSGLALALSVLSSGFYQVAGQNAGTSASIHIQYTNGVVTGGKTECAACITIERIPIQIPGQGPLTNGAFSSESSANVSASFVGYQKNAFNVSNIGAQTYVFIAWLQKGDGNTDTTRIEVGDGVFKYSNPSDGTSIGSGVFWASCGSAATNTLNTNPAIGDQNQTFYGNGSGSEFGVAQVTSTSNATYTMVEIARSFSSSGSASGACGLDTDPTLFILKSGINFNNTALQAGDFVFGNQQRTNLLQTDAYWKVSSQTTGGAGGTPAEGRFYNSGNAAYYGMLATGVQPC